MSGAPQQVAGGRNLVGIEVGVTSETVIAHPGDDDRSVIRSVQVGQRVVEAGLADGNAVIERGRSYPQRITVGIELLQYDAAVLGPCHHDSAIAGGGDLRRRVEAWVQVSATPEAPHRGWPDELILAAVTCGL